MKHFTRITLIVFLLVCSVAPMVFGESSWFIGDTVELVVTTTNMGDVDVLESNGMILVESQGGTMYDAGFFNVEGVVHPGESIEVPLSWGSYEAVPGMYSIILDGTLVFANGEMEDTYSVVPEAFLLVEEGTGLAEVPAVSTEASVIGALSLSDTFVSGGYLSLVVWVDNTGSTSFIPEIDIIVSDDAGEIVADSFEIYLDDPCEPGVNPFPAQCQLPDDLPPGEYSFDVDMNVHVLDYDVNTDEYPGGLDGFWLDNWDTEELETYQLYAEESDQDLDDVWFQFTVSGEPVGSYNLGDVLVDEGAWASDNLGEAFVFGWPCANNDVPDPPLVEDCESTYAPGQLDFINQFVEDDPLGPGAGSYQGSLTESVLGIPADTWMWTWYPAPVSEELNNVPFVVIEPTFDFDIRVWIDPEAVEIVGPEEVLQNGEAYFDALLAPDIGARLQYRWYLVPEDDEEEVPLSDWTELFVYPYNTGEMSARTEVFRDDLSLVSEYEEPFTLEVEVRDLAYYELNWDLDTLLLALQMSEIPPDERLEPQNDALRVEYEEGLEDLLFTDIPNPVDHRIVRVQLRNGYDGEAIVFEPSGSEVDAGEGTGSETGTETGTDTGTETDAGEETGSEDQGEQDSQPSGPAGIIQSIIDSIIGFFQSLFG